MKRITLLILFISLYGCQNENISYDKTYLIFIQDKSDGRLRYELYKINKSYNKFASGTSGITSNIIYLENENQREKEINKFKTKYPDSRIYVNHKLWD